MALGIWLVLCKAVPNPPQAKLRLVKIPVPPPTFRTNHLALLIDPTVFVVLVCFGFLVSLRVAFNFHNYRIFFGFILHPLPPTERFLS